MPFYEVHHSCTLTESQKQELATAITHIHCTSFSVPRLFVNIRFSTIPPESTFFIAGKPARPNQILAHVRTGGGRSTSDFNSICSQIGKSWDEIVLHLPKVKRSAPDENRELGAVFVLGDIVAGMERGFAVPEAGKDGEWMAEHIDEFKRKAEAGDEVSKGLLEDWERLKGSGSNGNGKTAKEQLEEALGWGDSA